MEDGERVSFANGGRSNTAEEAICPTWLPFNLFSKCSNSHCLLSHTYIVSRTKRGSIFSLRSHFTI